MMKLSMYRSPTNVESDLKSTRIRSKEVITHGGSWGLLSKKLKRYLISVSLGVGLSELMCSHAISSLKSCCIFAMEHYFKRTLMPLSSEFPSVPIMAPLGPSVSSKWMVFASITWEEDVLMILCAIVIMCSDVRLEQEWIFLLKFAKNGDNFCLME